MGGLYSPDYTGQPPEVDLNTDSDHVVQVDRGIRITTWIDCVYQAHSQTFQKGGVKRAAIGRSKRESAGEPPPV